MRNAAFFAMRKCAISEQFMRGGAKRRKYEHNSKRSDAGVV